MSRIYLVALEINIEKYLKIVKGNRKALAIEGALGALGIKKKFRKINVENLLSSWSILCDILKKNGSYLEAETFYATLLPDSLNIKGGSESAINNSFVFSALNGRKNEYERFLPTPQNSEQRDRAADMVSSLGNFDKIEIGVMAFFNDSGSEFAELLLSNRKSIGLPGGEIHIFEYCDDAYVYPSFLDVDSGKIDGFFAGNINSRMEMSKIRENILSLSGKFLIAHRKKSLPSIDEINKWLPPAKPASRRRSSTPKKAQVNKKPSQHKPTLSESKKVDYKDAADRLVFITLRVARKEDEIEAGYAFDNTLYEWIAENNIGPHDFFSLPGEYKSKLSEALIAHPDLNQGYDEFGGVARIEDEIFRSVCEDAAFAKEYASVIKNINKWFEKLASIG